MSSQIKNLKSQITKEKIKHLGVLFFSLLLTLAVFSQINAANPKSKPTRPQRQSLPATTTIGRGAAVAGAAIYTQPSDWLYYKASNDLSAYLGKKSSNLPTIRYQKGNDYLEFSMTGVSSTTAVSLETDTKTPNTPTLFYRNIFSDTDVNYQITNIPFRVKEEIVLKETFPTSLVGKGADLKFIFSAETSAKPVKQKDGSIAFFDGKGDYLFQLDKPFMYDAEGNRSEAVSIEIVPTNKKPIVSNGFFDALVGASAGIVNRADSLADRNILSTGLVYHKDNYQLPILNFQSIINDTISKLIPGSLKIDNCKFNENCKLKIENSNKQYQIILKADNQWLNDPSRIYPVVIDPTVTHNADANFTGQMNRIADNDSTSSTQLESSYPEATKDPYTVLLLHFNEANGTTAGIRDYASTTRVITANGNASTTNYVTQLGMGNSGAFDGTSDYFNMPDSDDWNYGASDFSIDFWVRRSATGATQYIMGQAQNGVQDDFYISFTAGNAIFVSSQKVGGGTTNLTTTQTITDTSYWHHITVLRRSDRLMVYIDSVADQTTTDLTNITLLNSARTLSVGTMDNYSTGLNGYLDSFRILKGRALTPEEIKAAASRRPYSVYTSSVLDASASVQWDTLNWTEGGVGTGDGEQPYNTGSLVAQWDFNDTSGTTLTASSSGSCTTACNGTLTNFAYTASQDQATTTTGWTANNKKWGGGALMFDGTNDYVSVGDNDAWNFGTGNFTIEMWMNFSVLQNSHFFNQYADGSNYWKIYFNNDTKQLNFGALTSGSDVVDVNAPWSPNTNTWYHIALVRYGSTESVNDWNLFVNGKALTLTKASGLWANSWGDYAGSINIGRWGGGSYLLNGIMDSLRIYKGRALSQAEILSNYNAGNIEIQTRTGATSDPNDGTWEAWKPTTGETQLFSLDNDAVNWHSDIMASTTIATSTETTLKMEGTGSLKVKMGMASTTANTVALWHMEETGTTTGTYLYDETANNNDATTTGTTVADGIFGKARKFNGTSDYVSVPDSANWSFGTGDFTIDFWVKTSFGGATTQVLAAHGNEIAWSNTGWQINNINAGSVVQCKYSNNGGVGFELDGASGVRDGIWHHVACVREGNTFKLYIDGKQDVTTTQSITILDSASIVTIGTQDDFAKKLNGDLDEFRILKGRALSPDEIAETYRMGANHHLTRQVSAVDLSSANKLAFNVAADRPGTYLETMLGESDYANYELASSTLALSTTTVLYIKGDEIASSTSIKDSSFSGKAITANGNARTSGNGKIGNSVYFDGTGDYLSLADSDDWSFGTGNFSIDLWVKNSVLGNQENYVRHWNDPSGIWRIYKNASNQVGFYAKNTSDALLADILTTNAVITDINTYYHIAFVRNGNATYIFVNGISQSLTEAASLGSADLTNIVASLEIGGQGFFLNGFIDELRIIKGTALSADQIRQAYEYGLRTHQITIDFGATLQTSDLISNSTDYNFNITATTSGLSATTSGLYLGDKIIIKENLGGTEYTAQGTVNAINTTTGAITVPSWDTDSSFPASNGYSPNATVFKWQREYFDLTGAATTTRNAITNLTLRPTNGAEGRTVWLDDFRYNTNYLTASSSSAITSSNGRYLQYRAVFSSWDSFVSPYLSAINALYTSTANMFPPLIGVSGGGFLSF